MGFWLQHREPTRASKTSEVLQALTPREKVVSCKESGRRGRKDGGNRQNRVNEQNVVLATLWRWRKRSEGRTA